MVLYGLTAAPVARRLGVAGEGANVVLVIGGHRWALSIARSLEAAGLRVRLWTGRADEQAAAGEAGLTAGSARLGVDPATREAELEEVSDALLLTDSDDFNALAAFELRQDLGHDHVYSLAPRSEPLDVIPAYAAGRFLFGDDLTFTELARRFEAGARLVGLRRAARCDTDEEGDRMTPLFVVSGSGELRAVTAAVAPDASPGDTTIYLADDP